MNILEGYADRLERRAGPRFCPGEDGIFVHFHPEIKLTLRRRPLDSAPDCIDNLYDELDDPSSAAKVITGVTADEAGWLAKYIREKSLRDREAAGEEVEQELQVRIRISKSR
jgi:breast cancer 2 susceptibility protein